ncbi:hypothetical protein [Winogradskyella luteola]|uniref:Uncharacterized protein n=1 Tax=Winogradskyella luteola TaxID=2828330 RepID=A0A9X1F6N7_9FLAO|nr:hypothetical protein [Winogradskyella luteola]MBV7268116.1 hypothetical protein [Winogradskyella luteola]
MATKNEKIFGLLIGGFAGGIYAYIEKTKNNKEKVLLFEILPSVFFGSTCGYSLMYLFGSPDNTINYTHFYKGKRVYEGITYADRFQKRMTEHRKNGKIFSRVIKDNPKPRIEALKLEKERIIKYKPINNIQFNK